MAEKEVRELVIRTKVLDADKSQKQLEALNKQLAKTEKQMETTESKMKSTTSKNWHTRYAQSLNDQRMEAHRLRSELALLHAEIKRGASLDKQRSRVLRPAPIRGNRPVGTRGGVASMAGYHDRKFNEWYKGELAKDNAQKALVKKRAKDIRAEWKQKERDLATQKAMRTKSMREYRAEYQKRQSAKIRSTVGALTSRDSVFDDMRSFYSNQNSEGIARARADRRSVEATRARYASDEREAYAENRRRDRATAKAQATSRSNYNDSTVRMARYKQSGIASRNRREAQGIKTWNKEMSNLRNGTKRVGNSIAKLGNNVTQAVGELTMFAGAITMIGYMATSIFTKIMALGDAFASGEKDFLVGSAFRNALHKQGGNERVAGFEKVVRQDMALSGRNTYQSRAFLARTTSMVKDAGVNASDALMTNLVRSAYGLTGVTGKDSEETMKTILEVAKKGKEAEKLGMQDLKLTRNMNENIAIIAEAVEKDPIASTMLRRGTIDGAMNRIRNAPQQLIGNLMKNHQGQITTMFGGLSDNIFKAFDSDNVRTAFAKTITNFEQMINAVFTPERIEKALIGLSRWGAELSDIGGKLMEGIMWFAENSETVIKWFERVAYAWVGLQAIKGVFTVASGFRAMVDTITAFNTLKTAMMGANVANGVGSAVGMAGMAKLGGLASGAWAFATNPITLGILGAGALAYGGYKLYNHYNEQAQRERDAHNLYQGGYLKLGSTIDPLSTGNAIDYSMFPTAGAIVNEPNTLGMGGYYRGMQPTDNIIVIQGGTLNLESGLSAQQQQIMDISGVN